MHTEHTPHMLAAPVPRTALPQVHTITLSLSYKFPHPLYVTQVTLSSLLKNNFWAVSTKYRESLGLTNLTDLIWLLNESSPLKAK